MNQYKHNIKEYYIIIELCALHQGRNEILKKYICRFKNLWKSIHIHLDEKEIYGIFVDSILLVIKQNAIDYIELGFGIMTKCILEKEKVLIELGLLKYANSTYKKDNRKPYVKKRKRI